MIRKFNNFKKMNESRQHDDAIQELIDNILDHVSEFGYENISELEKEILIKASDPEKRKSLVQYIESDDNEELSFDKLGHILINGVPYEQYQINKEKGMYDKKEEESDTTKWSNTSKSKEEKGPAMPPYRIRVYKNRGSSIRYFYIFWIEGEFEGEKKKFISIAEDAEKHPFGTLVRITSWEKETMEQIFNHLDDDYDQFRDLTPDELNSFETFLSLRKRFRKGELNPEDGEFLENRKKKKSLRALQKLYTKLCNV